MDHGGEREVETKWTRKRHQRYKREFLKGPIQIMELHQAAKLPGRSLALYLAIIHRTNLRSANNIKLTSDYLIDWGIDRSAKRRALNALVGAGLVRVVDRLPGRNDTVALIESVD